MVGLSQLDAALGEWAGAVLRGAGEVVNGISGAARVYGAAVQAREIHGGVHVHGAVPAVELPVPRQLLAPPGCFVGRAADVVVLERSRDATGGLLVVLSGPAGVGKTAFASYWLQGLTGEYPDGQLYVDLRGYAPEGPGAQAEPVEALGGLLRAFGISSVPGTAGEGAALWRSLTAGRRLVLMIDNAFSAAQVRPLLPGAPGSLVVVTSRSRLTGLGIDGAVFHQLDRLEAESAIEILRGRVGAARVAAEPEAARAVVERCDGLPLAVCVAAARIASRPRQSLAVTAAALDGEADRLAALRLEGTASAVRGALDASYRCLGPEAARLYRLLGQLPVAVFGAAVAAAAYGSEAALRPGQEELLLEALAEVNLVEELGPDRYRFHDLVRLHARELNAEGEDAAVRRVAEWYLSAATAAEALITPTHRRLARDYLAVRPLPPVPFAADRAAALAWLEQQQDELAAVLRSAAERGWDGLTWQLADAMWPLYHRLRPYPLWIEGTALGLAAARRTGDPAAVGRMLTDGGGGLRNGGRPEEAVPLFAEALELARRDGTRLEEAQALHGLGQAHNLAGRPGEAVRYFEEALALRREIGYDRGAALSVLMLGDVRIALGELDSGLDLLARARAELLALPDPYEAARALALSGRARIGGGEFALAEEELAAALAEFRSCGSRHWEAHTIEMLGELAVAQGEFEAARVRYGESLEIYRSVGAPDSVRLEGRISALPGGPGGPDQERARQ
ncbi:tetratricopeptide repeat protein [Kitasatospora sp. MMS16-BH015]|uniref:tetratricopeptide repeat protein n=1 Tax=Kitasatospora sp. MMS16-BH015 TaxID=2018025 RepID=UPI00131A558D|nr:tetratricopeptide repeat protein [Kitasatospora sp. MMS16-BH015]